MIKISERKEAWFRIIVLIITGVILYVLGYLTLILAIINWVIVVFSGKRNREIAEFCEYFNTEIYKYYRYLTLVSNERPFPFTDISRMSKFK